MSVTPSLMSALCKNNNRTWEETAMTEMSRRAALTLLMAAGATPALADSCLRRRLSVAPGHRPDALRGGQRHRHRSAADRQISAGSARPAVRHREPRRRRRHDRGRSRLARANPDGYTLLLTSNSTHSAAPGLFKTVPYDPIKDFTPIARIGSFPSFIAVTHDLPVKSIAELVAYAKANPGKINAGYGNSTGRITIGNRSNAGSISTSRRSPIAAIRRR